MMPSMVEALKQHAHEKYYASTQGEEPLREAISQWMLKNYGIERSPNNIIVTSGSKMIFYVLQMIFSGHLYHVSPSWVSYAPQAKFLNRQHIAVPCHFEDKYFPTAETIDNFGAIYNKAPGIIILNTPNNPTGLNMDEE